MYSIVQQDTWGHANDCVYEPIIVGLVEKNCHRLGRALLLALSLFGRLADTKEPTTCDGIVVTSELL